MRDPEFHDTAEAAPRDYLPEAARLVRYGGLLRQLVAKDLKLKYRGSMLGFLWSMLNPLLTIAVYSLAFRVILKVGAPDFPFFLLLGITAWTFFAGAAGMSTGAIVDNAGLMRSVVFPRLILPFASVSFNLVQYLLTVAVLLPVAFVLFDVSPAPPMLLFPLLLLLQVVFTTGAALVLSAGTVFFRDIRHLLEFLLGALFWTTPIVYPFRELSPAMQSGLLASPMTPFVIGYQAIFYYREAPPAATWWLGAGYAGVSLLIGLAVFRGLERRFAEEV